MRSAIVSFLTAAVLVSASCVRASATDDPNTLVIVFKDGRQQTISMADVARIEFKSSGSASSGGGSSFAGQGRFLGKWRVGNGAGGHFFITLEPSGVASKTLGASHGTWMIVGGEARISWDDGWHDAIRKVGDKYEKAAFEPGKSFTENPTNVAEAVNTTPQPN